MRILRRNAGVSAKMGLIFGTNGAAGAGRGGDEGQLWRVFARCLHGNGSTVARLK